MFELVINNKGKEHVVYAAEDKRLVELMRQRHLRALTEGEVVIREAKK